MNIAEVYEYLRDNGYLMASKGKYQFTKKWHEDLGTIRNPVFDIVKIDNRIAVLNKDKQFIDFIVEAKVPRRILNSKLEPYDTNKFSEDGAKVFHAALAAGVDYTTLVRTVQLYYASGNGYKKKIGNYFIDGDWKSDYQEMVLRMQEGEESLKTHITEELDNGEHTTYLF